MEKTNKKGGEGYGKRDTTVKCNEDFRLVPERGVLHYTRRAVFEISLLIFNYGERLKSFRNFNIPSDHPRFVYIYTGLENLGYTWQTGIKIRNPSARLTRILMTLVIFRLGWIGVGLGGI